MTYPVVVCYEIPLPDSIVSMKNWTPPRLKLPDCKNTLSPTKADKNIRRYDMSAVRREQFYKLTTYEGKKLKSPLFCYVDCGPWVATVYEEQSCSIGVPNEWELLLNVAGEVVHLIWHGNWEDIPSFPNLNVLMGTLGLQIEASENCSGYKWCEVTQSYIPLSVDCGDVFPV